MEVVFFVLSAIAVLAAIGVICFPQPLYSAFCLILNMVILAALFAMQKAHFLAGVQIIVYAGAIMVLVVFVIMLLSIGGEERKPVGIVLGGTAALAVVAFLYLLVPELHAKFYSPQLPSPRFGEGAFLPPVEGDTRSIGRLLYTKYVFSFEAASLLIIGAMVGAVMLAKRFPKNQEGM